MRLILALAVAFMLGVAFAKGGGGGGGHGGGGHSSGGHSLSSHGSTAHGTAAHVEGGHTTSSGGGHGTYVPFGSSSHGASDYPIVIQMRPVVPHTHTSTAPQPAASAASKEKR